MSVDYVEHSGSGEMSDESDKLHICNNASNCLERYCKHHEWHIPGQYCIKRRCDIIGKEVECKP